MTSIQILLITLIAFFQSFDAFATQLVPSNHIIFGALAGLALGDFRTGLFVGASCQLMSLGVAAIGGSSVPNYGIAAILGTTVAITTGQSMEAGLTIGVIVATLYVQIDVLVKILNGFVARKAEQLCEEGKFGAMEKVILISPILMGLSGAIPTFIACAVGIDAINYILNVLPAWFTGGLAIAGNALPVVGMGLLLNYMPAKKYFGCIMLGFVLSAYLNLGIIPIAIVGAVWAYEVFKSSQNKKISVASGMYEVGGLEDE